VSALAWRAVAHWQVGTRQDSEYHGTTAGKRDVRKEAANNTPTIPGAIWVMFCHKLNQQATKLKSLHHNT